jgi:aryl-alcohol dehydrogenase-like predicted oxidoreductase
MTYRNLGDSGLKVSTVCLGAMVFGSGPDAPCDEGEAGRIIGAFLDAGHNFIDTANIYTGGQSEEVVGRAIASRRESVILATKGRGPIGPGLNDQGLSRGYLTRALEGSLRRLGTDYVDLYQCHFPDADTPIDETMATLDSFVKAGKVRYLGCSNFSGSQIVDAQWAAAKAASTPFISLQPPYSLVARDIEADTLPTCIRHGVGTLVYSPLGGGVLTGKYQAGEPAPVDSRAGRSGATARVNWASRMLTERNLTIAEEVSKVAAELDTTPTAVAIAWVLGRRGVTSVIIGPRTFQQYEENLPGFDLALDEEVVRRLNTVSRPHA